MIERQQGDNDGAKKLVALLAATAQRDQAAFKALYAATSAKFYAVALMILRRRELVEDALQEAYVRIWNNAGRFDPAQASPITWMAAIVRNLAIDIARRSRDHLMEEEEKLSTLPFGGPSVVEELECSQQQRQLRDALNRLDPVKRRLVIAAYLNGESREQLAQRFGAPVSTVKSWLRRALVEMRAAFKDETVDKDRAAA